MTEHQDHDATTDGSTNDLEGIEETADLEALEAPAGALASGTLPLVGGGLLLVAAVRSLIANRRRAIPLAIVGSGLIGIGLRNRRSSDESTEGGPPEVEEGTDGKETSDQATAAANRVDSGRESETQPDGEISEEPEIDDAVDSGSQIEFTDEPDEDASRSRPNLGADEEEPRHETESDGVEVDVSDPAMADEVSEATGPSPEQAQPTQTADTEPEESPAEDASGMKVEPPDEDESESAESEGDAGDGENDGDTDRENDGDTDRENDGDADRENADGESAENDR
ncbi:hypothetical protein [Natrinema salaciae]|uniref:Uncharacterized protein n=1 Tax=Natrinema salaciae TaxID=1186196 RepID=A0A1H9MCR4_9EURY|nr:hypothetical protein [Natrinema salaciae]SER21381.1 hypothetical protein SAMN04489841_3307 [Natrinema salaciae]